MVTSTPQKPIFLKKNGMYWCDVEWIRIDCRVGMGLSDQRRPCISQDSKLEEFVVSPLMAKSLAYYTWIGGSSGLEHC